MIIRIVLSIYLVPKIVNGAESQKIDSNVPVIPPTPQSSINSQNNGEHDTIFNIPSNQPTISPTISTTSKPTINTVILAINLCGINVTLGNSSKILMEHAFNTVIKDTSFTATLHCISNYDKGCDGDMEGISIQFDIDSALRNENLTAISTQFLAELNNVWSNNSNNTIRYMSFNVNMMDTTEQKDEILEENILFFNKYHIYIIFPIFVLVAILSCIALWIHQRNNYSMMITEKYVGYNKTTINDDVSDTNTMEILNKNQVSNNDETDSEYYYKYINNPSIQFIDNELLQTSEEIQSSIDFYETQYTNNINAEQLIY